MRATKMRLHFCPKPKGSCSLSDATSFFFGFIRMLNGCTLIKSVLRFAFLYTAVNTFAHSVFFLILLVQ